MAHNVEYQISLKDLLSGKIKHAEENVNHFEHTLEHTKEMTRKMVGAAVGFFGLYQGLEFVKSSVDAYNNVEKSLSQLRAGLESTHEAAGVTYEELTEGAEKFAGSTIYNKEALLDMQAQLLSFPEITKQVFEQAEQAVLDLATRTGHSAHDVSIMVGKALGDPTKGVTALRRVGVEFTETQTEMIKKLATTGHLVQAQQMVLKELNREYAGSTAAASATAGGQLEVLKHQFDEVKESVGKLVVEESLKLAPAIKGLIKDFASLVHWVDENKESIKEVIKVVADVTIGMWAFGKTTAAIEGLIGLWGALKSVVIGTGEAMATTAATGAIGGAVAAEGAAVSGVEAATAGSIMLNGAAVGTMTMVGSSLVVALSLAKGAYDAYGDFEQRKAALNRVPDKTIDDFFAQQNVADQESLNDAARKMGTKVPDKEKSEENAFEKNFPKQLQEVLKIVGKEAKAAGPILEDLQKNAGQSHFFDVGKSEKDRDVFNYYASKEYKRHKANELAEGHRKTNAALSQNQTSIQGQTVKNINVTINGGLAKVTVNAASVTESKEDIKRIVDDALTAALNDAEINN